MIVKFKLAAGARAPEYQTAGASGMDLHARIEGEVILRKVRALSDSVYFATPTRIYFETPTLISTGVSLELPPGYEAQVRPRSSLSKRGIVAALGTIDADYRGDIGVVLYNFSNADFVVCDGDRIAQLVITPVVRAEMQLVDGLNATARGTRGWGSTGK